MNVTGDTRGARRAYDPDRLSEYVALARAERAEAAAALARSAARAVRDLFSAPETGRGAAPRPRAC